MKQFKIFMCRKIEIRRTGILLVILFMIFFKPEVGPNILPMSKSIITAHFNHSFLVTLALKTRTRVMALLVPNGLNLSPNLI